MRVLVGSREKGETSWRKLGTFVRREDGTMSLSAVHNGQPSGYFIRQGAKKLADDPTLDWVDMQHGSGPTYRMSRVD